MSIATTADLPAGKQLNAGLGILGVKVVGVAGTADYRLNSNVATTWANPDNDAAGSLAFDNPRTAAADDGELAADGAGTGIVTATRTGTLDRPPRRRAPRQRPGRGPAERRRAPSTSSLGPRPPSTRRPSPRSCPTRPSRS